MDSQIKNNSKLLENQNITITDTKKIELNEYGFPIQKSKLGSVSEICSDWDWEFWD